MKILHVVPGLDERGNGIAVAAQLIAKAQREAGHEVLVLETRAFVGESVSSICTFSEIWVHSNWWVPTILACWKVLRAGVPLVRMTHANLDPVRCRYHGWKKRLVAPVERWLFRKTARVVVTCEAERGWCEQWGVKGPFELVDLKQFFRLGPHPASSLADTFHVLYLGRRHPLKGVAYLERAVEELNEEMKGRGRDGHSIELREVSDASGEALEKVWAWCDALCLPTLSENFGLVVAEALARGKPVITTDGAPAWRDLMPERGCYLDGFVAGSEELRIRLLKDALGRFLQRARN